MALRYDMVSHMPSLSRRKDQPIDEADHRALEVAVSKIGHAAVAAQIGVGTIVILRALSRAEIIRSSRAAIHYWLELQNQTAAKRR